MALFHLFMDAEDLTDADRAILDELSKGARTKKAIVDHTGLHRNTVGNRLNVLEAGGFISCIHKTTALYELVIDPRSGGDKATDKTSDISISPASLDQIWHALDDLEEGLDRGKPERIQDALRRVHDALPDEDDTITED